MKVSLIDCSPKEKKSTSLYLLECIRDKLNEKDIHDITILKCDDMINLNGQDVIVFSAPLYDDTIPSKLIEALGNNEKQIGSENPDLTVYLLSNNAFYEPEHNKYSVDIIKYWCDHAKIRFGGAVCVGAGPIIKMAPLGTGLTKDLGNGLDILSHAINNKSVLTDDLYISLSCSMSSYMEKANLNWIKAAEKRGLSEDDLLSHLII